MDSHLPSWRPWKNPGDQHAINRIQWDESERGAVNAVFDSDWFGPGKSNTLLEEKLASFTGIPKFQLTNSGSSALMLAIHDLMDQGRLREGDRVLHPISTFSTSIAAAVRMGAEPVFIETKDRTYVADPQQVERALKRYPEIKGMILPHLLGNISDMEAIKGLLGDRFLIEDCCDTMGGKYGGQHVGTFGDYAAFSFYGSHHITTLGVGGAVATKSPDANERLKSLTAWGRDFSAGEEFLNRYKYLTIGTDSLMNSAQAAFGLKQMERLPEFVRARKEQFDEMHNLFQKYSNHLELPDTFPGAEPSWFSYPLVIKPEAPFSREEFVDYLARENKVEVRPIMCGNLLTEKAYRKVPYVTLDDSFPIGDKIAKRGFFIPAWGMPANQREHYYTVLENFLDRAQ